MSKLAALHQAAQQSEHLGAIRALEWYYQIALELAKEPGAEISALLIIGERLQEKINARYDEYRRLNEKLYQSCCNLHS